MAGESRRQRLRALLALAGAPNLDPKRVEAAFVHNSAVKEGLAERSNERLEFLGDAVLGLAVARGLFERYPNGSEGELALRKASLVSDAALAETAERLGLEALLLLGAGLANEPSSRRRSILADAFEALLAVLYHEAGFEVVASFIAREHVAERERVTTTLEDPKSTLQEWTQRRYGVVPTYVERAEGPDNERTFHSEVSVLGEALATGSGASKRAAQRAAAASALAALRERYGDVTERPLSAPVVAKPARRARTPRGKARP